MWFDRARGEQLSEVPYGPRPGQLLWTLGKVSVPDVFDTNAYAASPREQFINAAFVNNLALDYAQDTCGYTTGLSAQWVEPTWVARAGVFALPTAPGGPDTSFSLADSHSAQLELELHPRIATTLPRPSTLRLQAFRNVGPMRSYADATTALLGGDPNLGMPRRGAVRSGWGVNFDVPLADEGDTGLFGRAGWSDGRLECLALAEADQFASLGAQVSGRRWGRDNDVLGLAVAQCGLSAAHRAFLAAGGQGLTLGDGALTYGAERVVEGYYSLGLTDSLSLTLDLQHLGHPGGNGDRGPVNLFGLRLHYATPLFRIGEPELGGRHRPGSTPITSPSAPAQPAPPTSSPTSSPGAPSPLPSRPSTEEGS
jgi:high affinity Mn2+ porin